MSVFETLTKEQQGAVIEKYRYEYVRNEDWWESTYDFFIEEMEKLGYDNIKIQFTVDFSQSDDATFSANIDLEKYIKAHPGLYNKYRFLYLNKDCTAFTIKMVSVGGNNYYMITGETEDYTPNDWLPSKYKLFWEQVDNLKKLLLAEAKEKAKVLYQRLRAECLYLTSDEYWRGELTENTDTYNDKIQDWINTLDEEGEK